MNMLQHIYMCNKVLVAGGGIGDSTLFLAEQLNHTNAEVSKSKYLMVHQSSYSDCRFSSEH